jgi:hypothetical protein
MQVKHSVTAFRRPSFGREMIQDGWTGDGSFDATFKE